MQLRHAVTSDDDMPRALAASTGRGFFAFGALGSTTRSAGCVGGARSGACGACGAFLMSSLMRCAPLCSAGATASGRGGGRASSAGLKSSSARCSSARRVGASAAPAAAYAARKPSRTDAERPISRRRNLSMASCCASSWMRCASCSPRLSIGEAVCSWSVSCASARFGVQPSSPVAIATASASHRPRARCMRTESSSSVASSAK